MRNSVITRSNGFGLDSLFDEFFVSPFEGRRHGNAMMRTDVKETETAYTLDIEVPGLKKEDLNIEIEDGYLTVSGETSSNKESKDEEESYVFQERSYGSYSRSYYVGDIKENEIKASLQDGILKITLPKPEVVIPPKHKITID